MNEDKLHKFTMRKDEIIDNYIKLNKIMAKRITELDKEIEGLMDDNIQMYKDIESLNKLISRLKGQKRFLMEEVTELKADNLKQKFNK